LKTGIHKLCEGKFFIVLHSHKIQYSADPYSCFDKDKKYKFTYFCPKQVTEISSSGFDLEKNDFFFNPLVINLSNYPYLFNPGSKGPFTIAVFTRIANSKPIEPFIKAFAKIQKQTQYKCMLNLYGEIIDEDYYHHLRQLICSLGVNDNSIRFMGHTKDISSTIKQDKINLYWGVAINTSIGYASIEVGAMGIPSILWNLDESTDFTLVLKQTNNLMIVHNKLDDFVSSNLEYISNDTLLAELSVKQRDYIINKHHVSNSTTNFEKYITSIKSLNSKYDNDP
jgi:glycosyltransferase involved in cell wall biosynthesis